MRTAYPWVQSDSRPRLVFADSQGVIDFNRPVAKFHHAEDARMACLASTVIDEQLATLRAVLPLLEHELKHRQMAGLAEYIGPAAAAAERVKNAIAIAEGWKT